MRKYAQCETYISLLALPYTVVICLCAWILCRLNATNFNSNETSPLTHKPFRRWLIQPIKLQNLYAFWAVQCCRLVGARAFSVAASPGPWNTLPLAERYVDANSAFPRPTQPSIPSESVNEYSNPCNHMDYGWGGYHYTADQGWVWLFGHRSKSRGRGLAYGP